MIATPGIGSQIELNNGNLIKIIDFLNYFIRETFFYGFLYFIINNPYSRMKLFL